MSKCNSNSDISPPVTTFSSVKAADLSKRDEWIKADMTGHKVTDLSKRDEWIKADMTGHKATAMLLTSFIPKNDELRKAILALPLCIEKEEEFLKTAKPIKVKSLTIK